MMILDKSENNKHKNELNFWWGANSLVFALFY